MVYRGMAHKSAPFGSRAFAVCSENRLPGSVDEALLCRSTGRGAVERAAERRIWWAHCMEKIFILGVGAQRTGSTWLHSQLNKNQQINMGFRKEYHVFDAIFAPSGRKPEPMLWKKIKSGRLDDIKKEIKRLSFIRNPERYFRYFDKLYHLKPRTVAVGDMTPSYSMLDASAFEFIRAGLEKRGFHVKVIFLMRDPVERNWSMFHQAAKVQQAIQSNKIRKPSILTFTNPHAVLRTRYDRTMTELEKVFSPENIFYEFYERFFTPQAYAKLGAFLCIPLRDPEFEVVKNASLMKAPISTDLAKEASQHYAPVYAFILRRFGGQMLELWDGFRYLDN
jgi:hypothetical protein